MREATIDRVAERVKDALTAVGEVSSAAALDFEPPHVSRARRDREREGDPEPEVVERPLPNQAITEVELLAECGRDACESHLVRFVGRQRIPLPGYQPNTLNALCIDVNRDIFGRFTDLPGHERVEEAVEDLDVLLRRARVDREGACDRDTFVG